MKLVDILARELKDWPEGAREAEQSKVDCEIYMWSTVSQYPDAHFHASERADDYCDAVVTRAQWQEAREALSKPADAPAWNGEGHPPLGTICEFTRSESPFAKCEVVFSSPWVTVVRGKGFDDDAVDIAVDYNDRHARFRPIRTPEQIAADERLHKVRNAHSAIARTLDKYKNDISSQSVSREVVEAMIDAGYIKGKDGNQEA